MTCINCKPRLSSVFALGALLALMSQVLSYEAVAWNPATFVARCGGVVPPSLLCDPNGSLYSDPSGNLTAQLAKMNNNTDKGVVSCEDDNNRYNGYIVAVAIIDSVAPSNETDTEEIVTDFGGAVQKSWFGGTVCDNSTLVLVSLNTSKIYIIPGEGTAIRLRTKHLEVCDGIRVGPENVKEALMTCLTALDVALKDALKPYGNAVWGYTGVVAILFMLIFHYWIK